MRAPDLSCMAATRDPGCGSHGSVPASRGERLTTRQITPFNGPEQRRLRRQGQRLGDRRGQTNKPPGSQGIYQFDPYPSQTLLDGPKHELALAVRLARSSRLAVDQATDELFVAQSNGRDVDIFDEHGSLLPLLDGDQRHNGSARNPRRRSTTPIALRAGRVYLSLTAPENDVEAFDAAAAGRLPGHRQLHRRQPAHRNARRAVRRSPLRSRSTTTGTSTSPTRREQGRSTSSARPASSTSQHSRAAVGTGGTPASEAWPSIRPTATS